MTVRLCSSVLCHNDHLARCKRRRETDWRLRTCDTVVALAGIVALLQVAYLYLVK